MFTSDDDIDLPMSSSAQFTSADRGRRDRLEQKLHQKVDRQDLHKLKLSVLKQQMEGKKDDATKKMRQDEGSRRFKPPATFGTKPPVTFGTKTREQEIQSAQLDANVQIDADQMIDSGKVTQAAKDEQQKSGEVQSQPS